MKKFIPVLLVSAILIFSSCGNKNKETGSGEVIYDTLSVTNIKIAPEYFFAGDFTYMADAAVLNEAVTGTNIPVAMEEVYPEAEKQYKDNNPKAGEPVYAEFRGYLKEKGADEEGAAEKLVITQVVTIKKSGKPASVGLLTGEYKTTGKVLTLNPDHTYKLVSEGGKAESGKWFLSTDKVLALTLGERHTIMDVNHSTKELKTRDTTPVVFRK